MDDHKTSSLKTTQAPQAHPTPIEDSSLVSLRKIQSMVRGIVRDRGIVDGEQLGVDVWVKHWKKGLEPSWKSVRRMCYSYLRKYKRELQGTIPLGEGFDVREREQKDPGDILSDQEVVGRLMACPSLTGEDRKVIALRFYLGLTYEEIGERIARGEGVARGRVRDVIETLRRWWKDRELESEETHDE